MTFQFNITETNLVHHITLIGRLDSASSGDFEKSMQILFNQPGNKALIDFSTLDYISSAGLRVVLMLAKRAKQTQGHLILCGLQPHVKEVFEISGFLKILLVVDNMEAACAEFASLK